MSLVTMKEMLIDARREKRAVGAFNIANYETARAVLMAAERENLPVIIQLYNHADCTHTVVAQIRQLRVVHVIRAAVKEEQGAFFQILGADQHLEHQHSRPANIGAVVFFGHDISLAKDHGQKAVG